MSLTPEEFEVALGRIADAIPEVHRDLQAALVGEVVNDLVERSPVLTGAYRAAHAVGVGTGDGEAMDLVYDSPEHPDPDVNYTPGAQPIFQVPDGELARAAYEEQEPFQRAVVANDRPYAGFLEYGTATMAPRSIYASAEAAAEATAERLSQVPIDFESIAAGRK
jgi:hypothetical protein